MPNYTDRLPDRGENATYKGYVVMVGFLGKIEFVPAQGLLNKRDANAILYGATGFSEPKSVYKGQYSRRGWVFEIEGTFFDYEETRLAIKAAIDAYEEVLA